MPLLLLSVVGIVLILNAGWFAGAALVGWILVGVGIFAALFSLLVIGGVLALFKKV